MPNRLPDNQNITITDDGYTNPIGNRLFFKQTNQKAFSQIDLLRILTSTGQREYPVQETLNGRVETKDSFINRCFSWWNDQLDGWLQKEALFRSSRSAVNTRQQFANDSFVGVATGNKYTSYSSTPTSRGFTKSMTEYGIGNEEVPLTLPITILAATIAFDPACRFALNNLPAETKIPKLLAEQINCVRTSFLGNFKVTPQVVPLPLTILQRHNFEETFLDVEYVRTQSGMLDVISFFNELQRTEEDIEFVTKVANDVVSSGRITTQSSISCYPIEVPPKTEIELPMAGSQESADRYIDEFNLHFETKSRSRKNILDFEKSRNIKRMLVPCQLDIPKYIIQVHFDNSYGNRLSNVHLQHAFLLKQQLVDEYGVVQNLNMCSHTIVSDMTDDNMYHFAFLRVKGEIHNNDVWYNENDSKDSYPLNQGANKEIKKLKSQLKNKESFITKLKEQLKSVPAVRPNNKEDNKKLTAKKVVPDKNVIDLNKDRSNTT